ncbi:MAG: sigma-70 family RNA polymerase sigma factor [Aureliella sp.]
MNLTEVLQQAGDGDADARGQLIQIAYDDLRRLAAWQMARQRPDHSLTSTALVNEVSIKLLGDNDIPTENRAKFFAYVSRAMRNLLIDHARTKGRQKRGGDRAKFSFEEAMIAAHEQSEQLLALDLAMEELAVIQPRKAQVVEMRYFGGMTLEEIGQALDISLATVKRDWEVARTLLLRALKDQD